ncbi:Uncharacterised protein [Klebsiella pneumoniae]|nr:hypothetical protein AM421_001277 [Klebsiella pneumoniae]SAS44026.1 Uncharacterised protein [Klebsiella pneumoniae]SAS49507.1 Uncharacterised protein [Klebsiella pneumoniae]SAU09799.1 Uncharacterised protein [Klebsiella pneumoniae]SAU28250.1 Uncharacterised protein [Klebsiella pneumoniae]
MITMLYWTLFIYVIINYSGMFSSYKDKNNNEQKKRTKRTSTY